MRKYILLLSLCLLAFLAQAQNENLVTYPARNKVEWQDFREIESKKDTSRPFFFSTSIQMKTIKTNVWTGATTFEAYGITNTIDNWIYKEEKSEQLLGYCQLQYDIAHSVAKQLEAHINSKRINGAYEKKMHKIFAEYVSRLNQILRKMDQETQQGSNADIITQWRTKLASNTLES
jgi:hypothetical protein